ncbi:MAG: adaptor protein MecA [Clostridia bacterium]|nr:adaptor protein MecA [Clostridia bacterium]
MLIYKKITPNIKVVPAKKYVLTFNCFEDLACCCAYLSSSQKSILYRWEDGYRLLLCCRTPPKIIIIKEFCTAVKSGSTEFSLTEEYGKYIYGSDAVERINKAFNKLK